MEILDREGLAHLISKIKQEMTTGAGAVPVVTVGGTQPAAVLSPGKHYVFGAVTKLSITLEPPLDGLVSEYSFEFDSTRWPPTDLSLPDGIVWYEQPISIALPRHYIVSIRYSPDCGLYFGSWRSAEVAFGAGYAQVATAWQQLVSAYDGMMPGDILLSDLTWAPRIGFTANTSNPVAGICVAPPGHWPDGLPRIMSRYLINANSILAPNNNNTVLETGHEGTAEIDYPMADVTNDVHAAAAFNIDDDHPLYMLVNMFFGSSSGSVEYSEIDGVSYYRQKQKDKVFTLPYAEDGISRNEALWQFLLSHENAAPYDGVACTDRLLELFGTDAVAANACREYKDFTVHIRKGDMYLPTAVEVAYMAARATEIAAGVSAAAGSKAITSGSTWNGLWLSDPVLGGKVAAYDGYNGQIVHTAAARYKIRPFLDLKKVLKRKLKDTVGEELYDAYGIFM